MECPNEDWIDVVTQNQTLLKYQEVTGSNQNEIVNYIVHFTPENVLNNSKYKEWMIKFGTKTQHLIINENNTGFSSEAMHKMQHQLHLLHPTIFPFFDNQQSFANKTVSESMQENFQKFLKDMEVENVEPEVITSNDEPKLPFNTKLRIIMDFLFTTAKLYIECFDEQNSVIIKKIDEKNQLINKILQLVAAAIKRLLESDQVEILDEELLRLVAKDATENDVEER